MPKLYDTLLLIHVAVGFASLFLFWWPLAVRKGSRWHVRAGRLYANAMYAVAGSAFVIATMVLIDPIATRHADQALSAADALTVSTRERIFSLFLLSIAVLVLTSVRHGILSLRARRDHSLMRAPAHVALNVALGLLGLSLIGVGVFASQVLLYIFAAICTASAFGNLRYMFRAQAARQEWLIAHLAAMIGAGIGSYTAFFVFGGNQFFAGVLEGNWRLVPWVLPAIIGSIAIRSQARKYRGQAAGLALRRQPAQR